LVVTWTAAEGQALADVLTPGMLTDQSPARDAGCMGSAIATWAVIANLN
jgi:hypothetical protein